MKPEQIQIAIQELLQQIDATTRPANEVINSYTRSRRYIGSKDRHAILDGVWENLRLRPTPKWIQNLIPENELKAMQIPAQTILRINGDRVKVQKQLLDEGIESELTPLSPWGLILTKRINLNSLKLYQEGIIEVQDEGSQLLAQSTHIEPGHSVLDYCAGAGGKSLAFAQMMHNKGKIVAHDISKISLKELEKRVHRANIEIIQTTQKPSGLFDHVVVDAPCSGSGVWRRQPDAKFKLTPLQLKELVKKQNTILEKAQSFVKSNGFMHYMTCSLIQDENQKQIQHFLKSHKEFKLIHHTQFTPARHHTDGFFIATLQKI